ncbi:MULTISPECIES: AAA family ATPase [Vibrio]|uniref:MSHA biogenesis protein MshM n=1 Tax=Vibrio mediterranei TaxID=689 RepID=A0AAN1KMY4_9VIBR|nr:MULTISPECIES: AAA family ATPase [Vibrio]ASI89894.1 MSHA biogenesis protein MshM [Vibrio mediterranei]
MYLDYFGFEQYPFALTPNTALFFGLSPHYEAIQTVTAGVALGEGVLKVTGEVGTGKTLVCRMLIKQLEADYSLVYLPNPVLSGAELRIAIAKELGIEQSQQHTLLEDIQKKLIEAKQSKRPVVALIDEAQALSDEALETLRLLGNLETEDSKLMHLVLFGQPELDTRLEQHHLRQFRQRITFSATLRTMAKAECFAYVQQRTMSAGREEHLFSHHQLAAIWRASKGVPRLVHQICHKTLLLAFGDNSQQVLNRHLYLAIKDTFDATKPIFKYPVLWGWK